jgi:hypothetical protein
VRLLAFCVLALTLATASAQPELRESYLATGELALEKEARDPLLVAYAARERQRGGKARQQHGERAGDARHQS